MKIISFRMHERTILFFSTYLVLLSLSANAQQFAAKDTVLKGDCPATSNPIQVNSLSQACDSESLTKLADSGHVFLQNQMGIESALLLGANRSIEDARRVFQNAALRGSGPAQVNLAVLYMNGWGVPKNYGSALYWLKSAAAQGIPQAHMNLGLLYLNGWGVRQDYAEALRYFRFAAEHGDTGAMVDLGYMSDCGLGTEENQTVAAEWYRKAAEGGDALGQNNLADMYLRGQGIQQSDDRAFAWFQKAAAQGHTGARIKLGFLYMTGRGVRKDLEAAYAWVLSASLAGDHRGDEYLVSLQLKLSPPERERGTHRAQELQTVSRNHGTNVAFLH